MRKFAYHAFPILLSAGVCLSSAADEGEKREKPQDEEVSVEEAKAEVVEEADQSRAPARDDGRLAALRSSMVIKVVNPDEARDRLKKMARELGGFHTLITDDSIVLKVPPSKLQEAIDAFGECGSVITKTIQRQDLTFEIAQLEGSLSSKEEILGRLRSFFEGSDLESTLEIERTMTQLVSEIESIKGRLRLARERARWSVIEVSFRFRERENVVYVSSPFAWLNGANLGDFLEEF